MRRNAALFVLISLLAGFGSTAMTLSAGLWIFDLTGSVGLAALTGVCIYAPTLAGPWLGAVVDRVPRRPLLIGVDLLLGLLILTLVTVHSAAGLWLIFAVLLVRGISYVLLDAGESAILPSALNPALLGDVNGWRSSAQEGMKLVAPLAGAGLYAWSGAVPVILLSATMPLLAAGCYALVRLRPLAAPEAPAGAAEAPAGALGGTAVDGDAVVKPGLGGQADMVIQPGLGLREMAAVHTAETADASAADRTGEGLGAESLREEAGERSVVGGTQVATAVGERAVDGGSERAKGVLPAVRLLLLEREVRVPVLVAAVAVPLSGVNNAAVLARIVHGLHLPSTHLGFLASAQGAGSIVAGLLVGRLLARGTPTAVAAVGAMVFAAGVLAWCLPWWGAMITGSVLVGLGLPWTLIAAVTAVQTGTPDHLLGRVSATSNMLMFGPVALAIPLGSALVGLGARVPLAGVAVVALATGILALRHSRGSHRGLAPSDLG